LSLLNQIEISSAKKKYLLSLISAIISIGCFLFGTYNSITVIMDLNIPAYKLIFPIIFFICGFIGTIISCNCMNEYSQQWSCDIQ